MQPQHPIIAALVEQRQADLRGQADRWRLAHSDRTDRRSAQPIRRRWVAAGHQASPGLQRPAVLPLPGAAATAAAPRLSPRGAWCWRPHGEGDA
jgi:hypothetical protein